MNEKANRQDLGVFTAASVNGVRIPFEPKVNKFIIYDVKVKVSRYLSRYLGVCKMERRSVAIFLNY